MGTIICIALTIVILVVVIKSAKENKKQAELTKQRNDEKKQIFCKDLIRWNEFMNNLVAENGNYVGCIAALCNTFSNSLLATIYLYVFNKTQKIVITKQFGGIPKVYAEIPFNALLDVEILSEDHTNNNTVTETKTSLRDMAKRAIIGGAAFGGVGAVVGATTAKRTSITTTNNPKIWHSLVLKINSDILTSVKLDFHNHETLYKVAADLLKKILLGLDKQSDKVIINSAPIKKEYVKTLSNIAESKGELSHFDVMRRYGYDYAQDAMVLFAQFMAENNLTIEKKFDELIIRSKVNQFLYPEIQS